MERLVRLVCVLLLLAACGNKQEKQGPSAAATLADRLADGGTWVEEARYTGKFASTGCQNCEEVFLYRFERRGAGLRMSIDLYYDRAPVGHTDGELVCTGVMDIDVLPVDGPDPAGWAFLQETLVQQPSCFSLPGFSSQTWAVVNKDVLANWQTRMPDEAFPGWLIEGKRAFRVVPCAADSHAQGRPYCRPTCVAGASAPDACKYGPGPADPTPERLRTGCGLLPGWNAIDVAGTRRDLYLAAPRTADASGKLPAAFVWHGGGGDPLTELDVSGIGAHAVSGDAVALAPVARDNKALPVWDDLHDDSPDLALYDALHGCLPALGVDIDRVISTGMSGGGFFTANLLLRRADQLAAGAVFSGGMRAAWTATTAKPAALLVWGGQDDTSACAKPDGSVGVCLYTDEINRMATNLWTNDQEVILCNHGLGHTFPPEGPTLVWDLMKASVRGGAPPFADGLPSGWPATCTIDR